MKNQGKQYARLRPAAFGVASLSLFGAEGGAWGQTTPSEVKLPGVQVEGTPEGFKTESTSAGTRTDTPVRDIPQFINIVPQALIRSQGATTLSDALRNVPGISYGAAEGGTQANQVFFLRGFPLNQDIFVDALRDLGEYNRDLFSIESIEVLKGAAAMTFGRGSPGGVVNQTSKVADRVERREVELLFGSFEQKRATADMNFRLSNDSAIRLLALVEDSGSFRFPQDVKKIGFAPSVWTALGPATDLTFSYYYLHANDVTDYGQPTRYTGALGFFGFPPVSPRRYFGFASNDYADYQTHLATLKVEHHIGGAIDLRNTLRWANYKRQSESTITSLSATDANGAPTTRTTPDELLRVVRNHDTGRTRDNDDHALINQTELVWRTATGSVRHTVLGGLELARENLDRLQYLLDADPSLAGVQRPSVTSPFLDPDPYSPLSYSKTQNTRGLAQANTVAVYLQDQMTLTPEWKALIGLRWERYDADARVLAIAPTAAAVGPFGRTDNLLSGRAGVIWQPTQRQSYYLSYGNSYNPSGELGVYAGTANTNLSAINEELKPEQTRNLELGAQWDVGAVQIRGALFRTEKTNARFVDATGTTVLSGRRRVEGVELEASGEIMPRWELHAGIAVMDGKITRGPANVLGNTPLGVARVAGNLWTVYKLPGGWEVGGGVRGQHGTWLTDTNLPDSQIPGYAVLDAMVGFVEKPYEIRLNVYNFTDRTYYIGGYNNSPSRVLPGAPLSATISLRYDFY